MVCHVQPADVGGRPPGAKMTPGGGIPTSEAPIPARSASAPQGRRKQGRQPDCDCMDGDGDQEKETHDEQSSRVEAQ